jgi:hypothetical protein
MMPFLSPGTGTTPGVQPPNRPRFYLGCKETLYVKIMTSPVDFFR